MTDIRTMIRTLAGALALAGVLCLSLGCEPAPGTGPRGEPTATYTVRAKVEMVPEAGNPATAFIIHHEPIDEFINPDGSRGMGSMSMPVPVAKGVSLDGVRTGDVVEVVLAVWTTRGNLGLQARGLKKLPPDTVLHFGAAAPTLGVPGAGTPNEPRP